MSVIFPQRTLDKQAGFVERGIEATAAAWMNIISILLPLTLVC